MICSKRWRLRTCLVILTLSSLVACSDDGSQTGIEDTSTSGSSATTTATTSGGDDSAHTTGDTSGAETTGQDPTTSGPSTASDSTGDTGADSSSDSDTSGDSTGAVDTCGDTIVDPGEECDDGNEDDDDDCTNECQLPSGTSEWEHKYGYTHAVGDGGFAITVDDVGNVIVAGSQNRRPWIGKYDPDGNLIWEDYYFQVSYHAWNSMYGIDIDPDGDIYVAGTFNLSSWTAGFTRKYHPDGDVKWTDQEGGQQNPDRFVERRGVAALSDGSTISAGFSKEDALEPNRMRILKLDGNGNHVWERTYGPGTGSGNRAYGIASDSQDNVVVVGSDEGGFRGWARKYDSSGSEIWTMVFTEQGDDRVEFYGVVIDGNDNIAITGKHWTPGGTEDIWLRTLEPDGTKIATRDYGSDDYHDHGYAVATNNNGAYVVGGHQGYYSSNYRAWYGEVNIDGDFDYQHFPTIDEDRSSIRAMTVDGSWLYVAGFAPLDPANDDDRRSVWIAKLHR